MAKNKYIHLFLCFAAFSFCSSAAFLCYLLFFNTAHGWVHLLNQFLSALTLSVLISSMMMLIAIGVSRSSADKPKTTAKLPTSPLTF